MKTKKIMFAFLVALGFNFAFNNAANADYQSTRSCTVTTGSFKYISFANFKSGVPVYVAARPNVNGTSLNGCEAFGTTTIRQMADPQNVGKYIDECGSCTYTCPLGGTLSSDKSTCVAATPSVIENAAFVSYSAIPSSVEAGKSFAVDITMKNTGTSTWHDNLSYYAYEDRGINSAVSVNYSMAPLGYSWKNTDIGGSSQVNGLIPIRSSQILPGQQVTMRQTFTAPSVAGMYDFQYQMYMTLNGSPLWFGEKTPLQKIEVTGIPVNGMCGAASTVMTSDPTTLANFCNRGAFSGYSGTSPGPWTWSCIGSGEGSTTSCSTIALGKTPTDGHCDPAFDGQSFANLEVGSCISGTYANFTVFPDSWSWDCFGIDGGLDAETCVATKASSSVVNGSCGSINEDSSATAPTANLCATGTPSAVRNVNNWYWDCLGSGGGINATNCVVYKPTNAACGSDNDKILSATPVNLCAPGAPSAVSGTGPWSWTCYGLNDGNSATCSAQKNQSGVTVEGWKEVSP